MESKEFEKLNKSEKVTCLMWKVKLTQGIPFEQIKNIESLTRKMMDIYEKYPNFDEWEIP
jgi:hypothetical protein